MALIPCLECGELSPKSRCPKHRPDHRLTRTQRGLGSEHDKMRRLVVRPDSLCHWCGRPATVNDPLTADHLIPRAHGGTSTRENLVPAHRSCNSRRGAGRREP